MGLGKERAEGGREMEKGGNGWDGVEGTEWRAERGGNATMRLYGCGRQTGNACAVAAQAFGGLTTWLGGRLRS